MENTIEPLHLAVAFDQNYITPFYVLITSIFQNSQGRPYHIHTIATGISSREKEEINSFVRQQQSAISFYELDLASVVDLVLPKLRRYADKRASEWRQQKPKTRYAVFARLSRRLKTFGQIKTPST